MPTGPTRYSRRPQRVSPTQTPVANNSSPEPRPLFITCSIESRPTTHPSPSNATPNTNPCWGRGTRPVARHQLSFSVTLRGAYGHLLDAVLDHMGPSACCSSLYSVLVHSACERLCISAVPCATLPPIPTSFRAAREAATCRGGRSSSPQSLSSVTLWIFAKITTYRGRTSSLLP